MPGNRSEETYGHTMTGDGPTPRERKRERVTCGDCGKEMAAGSLDSHRMTQHGKAREIKWSWTDAATGGEEQQTYRMEFPKGGDNGMPSRRVPGEGRDKDSDARALLEESRAGHNHHLGGGKPPPPKI